jgi:hypothetical protein
MSKPRLRVSIDTRLLVLIAFVAPGSLCSRPRWRALRRRRGDLQTPGCTTRSSGRGLVFVEQATEEVAPPDLLRMTGLRRHAIGSAAVIRRSQVERSVCPLLVEVGDVDAEDVLELAAAEDEKPVEALSAHARDPAFGVGARVRRLDRRLHDLDAFTGEAAVEGAAELRVTAVGPGSAAAGRARRGP